MRSPSILRSAFFLRLIALVPAALALSAPSFSQQELIGRDPQKLWALIVGISNYSHAQPLVYAAQDAAAISNFLKSPRGRGFPEDHVFTLLEDQATRSGILKAIDRLAEKAEKGEVETVGIYLAGHGFTKLRHGYFVPSDASLDEITSGGISFAELKALIDDYLAKTKQRILVTDICNAGRINPVQPELVQKIQDLLKSGKTGPEQTELAQKIQNVLNEELLKLGKTPGGSFLNLLASRANEASWENDELGAGVFTHVLLEALNGKAAAEGKVPIISAKYVIDYLNSEVPKYTANTQHPQCNPDYDPNLALSYLDRPGPPPKTEVAKAILEILNIDKRPFSRVQWIDPRNRSDAVRQLPRDQNAVQISSLPPGELELHFYDAENRPHSVKVKLQPGKNDLDLTRITGTRNFLPLPGSYAARLRRSQARALGQAASLTTYIPLKTRPSPQPPAAATETEAALLMQLQSGTEVYVDGSSYGMAGGSDRFLQLEGLAPGYHNITLIPTPDREQRFRVRLFKGPQIFDRASGEVRAVVEIQPSADQLAIPVDLPSNLAQDYRRFVQALWQERLIAPLGDSAWDYYQRMQSLLPATLRENLQRQLAVAMGDRAQRIILRYLRGRDIVWNAAAFEEGANLLDRTQRLFKTGSAFEPQKRFFTGRASLERGEYAQAVPELQRVIAIDPEAAYAYNALGQAFWKQNRLQEAIQPLERSIQLAPNWSYPRDTLAFIYLEQRLYQQAEQAFQQSIQLSAESSAAYHGLGQLYLLQGRFQDAEAQVRRAIEINPGNAYAYETLGKLFQGQRRNNQAEQMFRLAIRLEPDEPSFQISLAQLLQQIGRLQDAQPFLARAVDRNPNNRVALEAYASFLTEQNKFSEAEKLFRQAFKISPDDSNLHVGYGRLLFKQGRAGDAEKEFKTAIRLRPDNPFAHWNLARIYVDRQKIPDAEKELALAEKADSRFAKTPLLLGQIRQAQKRHREALDYYRKALALSIEPAQRQEIEGYVEEIEGAIAQEKLEQAKARTDKKDYPGAWMMFAEALRDAPDQRQLREAMLRFQQDHPAEADPSLLPSSTLSQVLKTPFWKTQRQSEELWRKGDRSQATESFIAAIERLAADERRVVSSTSFNIGNSIFGIHQFIYVWGLRLIEERNYQGTLRLMDVALQQHLFGVVPDFSPFTVDSLMISAEITDPKKFSEFDVAHHPDHRAHELYAAAYAGMGDMVQARQYLPALETTKPDLAARMLVAKTLQREKKWNPAAGILQEVLQNSKLVSEPDSLAEAFVLLAEIQCQAGECGAGRKTLESGLRILPNNPRIKEALGKL
jgi:tetratricopeptide (TPR) repeat protein/uncharacterized caspase-like protein